MPQPNVPGPVSPGSPAVEDVGAEDIYTGSGDAAPELLPGPADEQQRETWALALAVGAGLVTVLGTWGVLFMLVVV